MAKQAAVALAAAGFLLVLVLARGSHAGANQASTTSGSTSGSSSSSTRRGDDLNYGPPSVAPSPATPQAQTSVS
jgi:hypothetical protein